MKDKFTVAQTQPKKKQEKKKTHTYFQQDK